jgi:hypothetical protein
MDVSAMIAEIQEHGFEDMSSARIVAAINDAYHDVSSRIDWPWMRTVYTDYSVSGNTNLTLSGSWKKIHKMICLTTKTIIPYREYYELIDENGVINSASITNGEPTNYYIWDDTIKFWPPPDAVRQYSVWATIDTTDLTSSSVTADIAIPAKHHRVLVLGALKNLYPLNDDLGAAQYFEQQFEKRIQWMIEEAFDKQGETEKFIVDSYDY